MKRTICHPFLILTDLPDERTPPVAEALGRLRDPARRLFGREMRSPLIVVVHADSRAFRADACLRGASNAESLYDPRTHEAVLPAGLPGFLRNLAHEVAHGWMDLAWACTSPLWFAEGMAEVFAERAGYGPPPSSPGEPMALSDLLGFGREVFYGPSFPAHYWRAYRLARFLSERHPEVVQTLLQSGRFHAPPGLEEAWLEGNPITVATESDRR